jgi:presenilin-like A22 family membrane protease
LHVLMKNKVALLLAIIPLATGMKEITSHARPAEDALAEAIGDVVIVPTVVMASSLTGAATSMLPGANLSHRAITAHLLTRKPSPKSTAFSN